MRAGWGDHIILNPLLHSSSYPPCSVYQPAKLGRRVSMFIIPLPRGASRVTLFSSPLPGPNRGPSFILFKKKKKGNETKKALPKSSHPTQQTATQPLLLLLRSFARHQQRPQQQQQRTANTPYPRASHGHYHSLRRTKTRRMREHIRAAIQTAERTACVATGR